MSRPQVGLVDLLDRVLDRGLLINADIIISLAGVPLIGINLRAALAGMDTMVKYGLMQEWDNGIREAARSGHNMPAPATGALPASVMPPRLEEGVAAWQ
ncbi:MAG: gas vesicle protein GVPa [Dehalococcoidia bacterium]|nr:gas vesicle protein GVPa [Dehalococcoidia bacterium]